MHFLACDVTEIGMVAAKQSLDLYLSGDETLVGPIDLMRHDCGVCSLLSCQGARSLRKLICAFRVCCRCHRERGAAEATSEQTSRKSSIKTLRRARQEVVPAADIIRPDTSS